MSKTRVVSASATVVLTLALLVGATTTAAAAPPVPSTNLTCAKLEAATDPQASFSVPISRRYSAAVEERAYGQIPDANVIQMAGGLDCDYSNGIEVGDGAHPDGVGVHVQYLPYAAPGYWQWANYFGPITTPDNFGCFGTGPEQCLYESSAGGDWLVVWSQAPISDAVAEDLSHRISDALQLGQKTPYVPPIYATNFPHTCATAIRPAVWRAAVGSSVPLVPLPVPVGWDLINSAQLVNHSVFCDMDNAGATQSAGSIQTLPGGRWAFLILQPSLTTPGPLTPISVPDMRPGDTAYTRCAPGAKRCVLDALIATHWIEVDLWDAARGGTLITTNRRAAMGPLLTEIVHQIYTP